jgi:hypothetical protein
VGVGVGRVGAIRFVAVFFLRVGMGMVVGRVGAIRFAAVLFVGVRVSMRRVVAVGCTVVQILFVCSSPHKILVIVNNPTVSNSFRASSGASAMCVVS